MGRVQEKNLCEVEVVESSLLGSALKKKSLKIFIGKIGILASHIENGPQFSFFKVEIYFYFNSFSILES